MSDNAALLRTAYDAFGRGDIPAVLATFDENIEWHAPEVLPHGATANGRDGVAEFFQRLASIWESFGIEIDDIAAAGDRAYASGRATGVLSGEDTGYGFVHVWTLRNGLCVRFDEYVDPSRELVAVAAAA